MQKNTVIFATYQAIEQLAPSEQGVMKALQIVDDVYDPDGISPNLIRKFITSPKGATNKPVAFAKLQADAICVDEIHNFNELMTKNRLRRIWINSQYARGDRGSRAKKIYNENYKFDQQYWYEWTTGKATPNMKTANLRFKSSGKSSSVDKMTLLALTQDIFVKNQNKDIVNSMMLSATPFTDNIFQMLGVFAMVDYQRMLELNIWSPFKFYENFAIESWKLMMTHKGEFEYQPVTEKFINMEALQTFRDSLSNFKSTDKEIEANRPTKLIIPQQDSETIQDFKVLEDVDSKVPLTKVQESIKERIEKFIAGEFDDINTIIDCAVSPKAGKKKETTEVAGDEDEEIAKLLKEAKKSKIAYNKDKTDEDSKDRALDLVDEILNIDPNNEDAKDIRNELDETEDDELEITAVSSDSMELLMSDEDKLKSRAIQGQKMNEMLVLSPYFIKCDEKGNLTNAKLPPLSPKNFVNESPKFKYTAECIKSVIDHHISKKEDISGQVVYFNTGANLKYAGGKLNAFVLFRNYLGIERSDIGLSLAPRSKKDALNDQRYYEGMKLLLSQGLRQKMTG